MEVLCLAFAPHFLLFNPFCKRIFHLDPDETNSVFGPNDRRNDLWRRDNTSQVVCTYYAWQLRWHRRDRTLGATNPGAELGAKICGAELPAIMPPLLSLWPLFRLLQMDISRSCLTCLVSGPAPSAAGSVACLVSHLGQSCFCSKTSAICSATCLVSGSAGLIIDSLKQLWPQAGLAEPRYKN